MLKLQRTTPDNPDYRALVTQLDAYLARVDGDDHQFYHQFNGPEGLQGVVVAYQRTQAVGCGALKPYSQYTAEVKRMFTLPQCRGQGVAGRMLGELEQWARELG